MKNFNEHPCGFKYCLLNVFLALLMVFLLLPASVAKANADSDNGTIGEPSNNSTLPKELLSDNNTKEDIFGQNYTPIDSFTTDIAFAKVTLSPDKEAEVNSQHGKIKIDVPLNAVTGPIEIELLEKSTYGSTAVKMLRLFELNAFKVDTSEKDNSSNDSIPSDKLSIQNDLPSGDNSTLGLGSSNGDNITLPQNLTVSDNLSLQGDLSTSGNLTSKDNFSSSDNISSIVIRQKINNFHFEKEITISIQHTAEELAGLDLDSLHLYYLDEDSHKWVLVPGQFDRETLILTAQISHFSYYGEIANPLQNGPGRVMASQVGLYSGTSSYSYPIELPPGPGGFTPSLTLTYNSGSVDSMKNKRDMGSWVGVGWSLGLGKISCELTTNKYFLDLNGASFKLISSDNISYTTQPDQYLQIKRIGGSSGNTWELRDKSGVKYTFGSTDNATQYVYDTSTKYYRWDLSQIVDTNGNIANIGYTQEIIGGSANATVRSAYPTNVTYGNNTIQFSLGYDESGADGYLRFDNPISIGSNPAPKIMETRRLNNIQVFANGNLLRNYSLSYSTTNRISSADSNGIYYSGSMKLNSITQYGSDNVSALPATIFVYEDKQVSRATSETLIFGNPGNPATLIWPFLTQINSGYGGNVGFTYTQIPNVSVNGTWSRQAVTAKAVNSGIGPVETYQYSYSGYPQYLGTGWDQEFRGWNEVQEKDAANNSILHYFYTTGTINGKNADILTGKEYQTKWFDNNDVQLKEKNFDWNVIGTTGTGTMTFYPDPDPEFSSVDGRVRRVGSGSWNNIHDGAGTYCDDSETWDGVQIYANDTQFLYITRQVFFFNTAALGQVNILSANLSLHGVDNYAGKTDTLGGSPSVNIFGCTSTSVTSLVPADYGNCQTTPFSTAISFSSWSVYTYNDFPLNTTGINNINKAGLSRFSFREATYDAANITPPWVANGTINFSTYLSEQGSGYKPKLVVTYGSVYILQLNSVQETFYSASGNNTSQTRYVYDNHGNVITEYQDGDLSNPNDNSTTFYVYSANTTTNILNKVTQMRVYSGNITTDNRTNALKETLYYYDGHSSVSTPPSKGNLTSTVQSANVTSTVSNTLTYDDYGNLQSSTDASGNTTNYAYDPDFHIYLATKTVPVATIGVVEDTNYEWNWQESGVTGTVKITSVDANGNTTVTYYDTFNRIWKVIRPNSGYFADSFSSPSIEYQYLNWGSLGFQCVKTITKVSQGNYLWQAQYFDGLGRVVQTQSNGESGHTVITGTTAFNTRGLADKQYITQDIASVLTSYQAPSAGWKYSTSAYDALGRVVAQTGPDNTTVTHDYSAAWTDNVTDTLGHRTVYSYDAFNHLSQVIEWDSLNSTNATTHYTYDVLGNLKQVTDNENNITTMTYNWLSQKTDMYDPDMGHWQYQYDVNGNLWKQTDAKGQTITMGYDAVNRLISKTYPDGSGTTPVTYEYDSRVTGDNGKGQRTFMSDASGNTTYTYDGRGHLKTELRLIDGTFYITQFGYDGADRLNEITYNNGEVVTQTYDGRGLPYSLASNTAGLIVTGTQYNAPGAMKQINLGNGIQTSYSYWGFDHGNNTDSYGKLWEIQTSAPALQGNHLTVNSGGHVEIPGEGDFTYPAGDNVTIKAIPDPGYRFVCWTGNTTSILDVNAATTNITINGSLSIAALFAPVNLNGNVLQRTWYTWDANGNLLNRTDNVTGEAETFIYDSLDRLHQAYSTGPGNNYSDIFTYSTIGNITSRNGVGYNYPINHVRPHAVIDVGSKHYAYDANGNMETITESGVTKSFTWDEENRPSTNTQNGTTTTYIYDGDGKRVKTTVFDGQNTTSTVYVNNYLEVTGNETTIYYYLGDKQVAQRKGAALQYFHQDYLNSTNLMTDLNGLQLGTTVKYWPFGQTLFGSLPSNKLFTGQRLDITGIYYFNARYYDPAIGRFLSPDTAAPDLTNPQSFNKYTYCLNNPLKYTDPSGNWPNWSDIWGGIKSAAQATVNFVKENAGAIQTGLSLVGMIPGVGIVADLASAAISACTGDWVGMGMSLVSAVPVIGDAIGAGKLAEKAVGSVSKLVRGTEEAAEVVKIGTYSEVKTVGLQTHHFAEQRFVSQYEMAGLNVNKGPCTPLSSPDHLEYTNAWRREIPYSNSRATTTTINATIDNIRDAGQRIYANNPEYLDAFLQFINGAKQ